MLRPVAAAVTSPSSRATTCGAVSMPPETPAEVTICPSSTNRSSSTMRTRRVVLAHPGNAGPVLDSNVFVAAGSNPGSHSARLVEAVRDGRLRMIWDDATHAEIEHVMRQIPRLSWTRIADLFRSEDRFGGSTHPEAFGFVPDPADRKFAALADAVQAPLVTSDAGLLNVSGQMAVPVVKPSEFARLCGAL